LRKSGHDRDGSHQKNAEKMQLCSTGTLQLFFRDEDCICAICEEVGALLNPGSSIVLNSRTAASGLVEEGKTCVPIRNVRPTARDLDRAPYAGTAAKTAQQQMRWSIWYQSQRTTGRHHVTAYIIKKAMTTNATRKKVRCHFLYLNESP